MKLYMAYRYQQRHCLAALPAKMSVFKSHMPATFQWLQMNPDYTEKKHSRTMKIQKACVANKNICVYLFELKR